MKPIQLRNRKKERPFILPKKVQEWLIKHSSINKLNAYHCPEGHHMVTIDLVTGVTPFIVPCYICGKEAISDMYKVPEGLTEEHITHEWYRPKTYAEIEKHELEHCKQGGLLLRPRKKTQIITL